MASLKQKNKKMVSSTTSSSSTGIFKDGLLGFMSVEIKSVKTSSTSLPKPLLILTPMDEGTYPVLLFLHGFCLANSFYSKLLRHITTHGFICVAPQLYNTPPDGSVEIESIVKVTNWLYDNLQLVLPKKVEPDLKKFALAGHSRGGKAAFSVALEHEKLSLKFKFSALLGIDPVAGTNFDNQNSPKILTKIPNSFNLRIPVMVLGTGLIGRTKPFMNSCTCALESHVEFYSECKSPCYHFVPSNYGHMDMLDDDINPDPRRVGNILFEAGEGSKDPMRRCVGGIVVAFLRAYLKLERGDLEAIINDSSIAPVKLDPIEYVEA